LSLVVQVVGFPHTTTRPANPNCWLTLLESMQSTSLGVLTGATHLVLTLPPASAMTDLLSDALRDIGWEVVLGNGSPGLSPLSCADILQSVPGSGESDTILLQPALWSPAMASTLWAARPEDRQLLAIVQWGVDPWGIFRECDRIVTAFPTMKRPLRAVPKLGPPPLELDKVTLEWGPTLEPIVPQQEECPWPSSSTRTAIVCSLCGRHCQGRGHSLTPDGLPLCILCLRCRGHTSKNPYCTICVLPLAGVGVRCAACKARAHAVCAQSHWATRAGGITLSCPRAACVPTFQSPGEFFSPFCMASCNIHLTQTLGAVWCTGPCGRGWCSRCCSPQNCCRSCSSTSSSRSKSPPMDFEKQNKAPTEATP
jgi:hypothetical protein